jgi:PIN domain nuclease of toxin-antitoxin system
MAAILDASAYLAYANDESGAEVVQEAMIEGAVMSVVNLAEVLSIYIRRQPGLLQVPGRLPADLPGVFGIEEFTAADAVEVAELWPISVGHGLGLGDRACLALGRRLALPVLTADRAWAEIDPERLGVEVRLIR